MEQAVERKNLVQELRAFARQTGVAQVRDDRSRARAEAMFQGIVAKAKAGVPKVLILCINDFLARLHT